MQDGAARFAHEGCSILQDDVVDYRLPNRTRSGPLLETSVAEVAGTFVGPGERSRQTCHEHFSRLGRAAKAFATACTRCGSSGIRPVAVALYRGTDDEAVGRTDIGRCWSGVIPEPTNAGIPTAAATCSHVVWFGLAAGRRAGDDHAIGECKLGGVGGVGQSLRRQ